MTYHIDVFLYYSLSTATSAGISSIACIYARETTAAAATATTTYLRFAKGEGKKRKLTVKSNIERHDIHKIYWPQF